MRTPLLQLRALSVKKKNQEISVGAKVDSPIGKKLFHLVVNPGVLPVTRRDTKMAAELVIILQILDELVDEEVEILFGFDEEEDINVVAATSTFNSLNNPEQTTQRYVKSIRNGSHHF